MNNELEWIWKEAVSYPSICLKILRKTTKNVSQYSRGSGSDPKGTPLEYNSRTLSLIAKPTDEGQSVNRSQMEAKQL
jgi:hypothetical protein